MDLLSDILSHMQLEGMLYFRTSFTSPWSVRMPSYKNVARFHFAHRGRCLVRISPDEPPVFLEQGDFLIIMRGSAHTLYCDPTTENPATRLDDVVERSGFNGSGVLVYGELGTDQETQLVCGHFAFGKNVQHPLIDALPNYIHIKDYANANGMWMEHTLKIIGNEAGSIQMGGDLIAMKMSEIIFAQAIRGYLEKDGLNKPVLAGFADNSIAQALTAIHKNPGNAWTLENLSQISGMSRTAFTARFSALITMSPLKYITFWRMQLATQHLTYSNAPIVDIAEMVGYQSEEAFSRVFKRYYLKPPGVYRRSTTSES